MIEKPPKEELNPESFELYTKLAKDNELKSIQDEYLYWDKIKHKAKAKGIDPKLYWSAVKIQRMGYSKPLFFGNVMFGYSVTEYIQKALHHFDLNIGGLLGSNSGIAETDKTKYMLSSIMEEAISSSGCTRTKETEATR